MICCYVVVQQRVTVSARRWQPDGGGGRAQSSHVGAAKRFLQQLLSGCQLPQLQQMSTQIDGALVPGSAAVFVGLLLLKVVNWVGCGRRENLHIPIFTCVYVYRYLLIFGAQAVPGIHFGAPAVPWVYMCMSLLGTIIYHISYIIHHITYITSHLLVRQLTTYYSTVTNLLLTC